MPCKSVSQDIEEAPAVANTTTPITSPVEMQRTQAQGSNAASFGGWIADDHQPLSLVDFEGATPESQGAATNPFQVYTGTDPNIPGTATVPFQAQVVHEKPSPVDQLSSFHSIFFQEPYLKFSPEELRLADYTGGRIYGKQNNSKKRKFDTEDPYAKSSADGASRVGPGPCSGICDICGDQFGPKDRTKVPCGHEYCRECLQRFYNLSITDDSLFPPRCCEQEIASAGINSLLTPLIVQQYEQKRTEFSTTDRTYCSNRSCSAFVGPKDIANDRAKCPECNTSTCTMCKEGIHSGDCPADTALKQVLDLAAQMKWQRCKVCGAMVELKKGCYHIWYLTSLQNIRN